MSNDYLISCVEVACALVEKSAAALEDEEENDDNNSERRPIITSGSGDQCLKPNDSGAKGDGCLHILRGYHDHVFPDPSSALNAVARVLQVVTKALKSEKREILYRFQDLG